MIELAQLEPPRSLDRITRFAEEIATSRTTQAVTLGQRHLSFAERTVGRNDFRTGSISPELLAYFLDRYQIGAEEFRDFARWLTDWSRLRLRMDYVKPVLAPGDSIDSQINASGFYVGAVSAG